MKSAETSIKTLNDEALMRKSIVESKKIEACEKDEQAQKLSLMTTEMKSEAIAEVVDESIDNKNVEDAENDGEDMTAEEHQNEA